jgi:phenylalanyl-tRNA synthetase beta chain
MRFSENWLRTLVNPQLSTRELADALTMHGVEIEHVAPAAPAFDKVVVGEVLSVAKHPDADRLSVCQVNVGVAPLTIVCGAPNVRAGMKVPTALAGARLPGSEVRRAKVRGVQSEGMLCSAKELGIADDASGLLNLPEEATIGADVRELLELDDQLLTTKPTPNRGDCLSLLGMAREVAAVTGARLNAAEPKAVSPTISDRLAVALDAPAACPLYCGRLVRGVNAAAATPQWMAQRLARSGIRAISPIVDITNYVMLELGQPLHAFDAAKLDGGLRVRLARDGEKLTLLNGETPTLDASFLVIADEKKALALAGIMGGLASAVSGDTRDIFLESAFFAPDVIAGKSRVLGFSSDSAYRFERGVDFEGTPRAIERATQLVVEICGGAAGPVVRARDKLPKRDPVRMRLARAERLLGITLGAAQVDAILRRLGCEFTRSEDGFRVTPPSYRFDIAIEEDLIEEVARGNGYDKIPEARPAAPATMLPAPESRRDAAAIRRLIAAREYQEIVTYSFVDSRWEAEICGNAAPIALKNPIASQMSVMRSSLIGGLLDCVIFNVSRRQTRVRVFEIGRCFARGPDGDYLQPLHVGGMACGPAAGEQWGLTARDVDFYDAKGDVEALLAPRRAVFDAVPHPALHPGKSARVSLDGRPIGWIGQLHPRWQQKYDLPSAPVLFELELEPIARVGVPAYKEISKFPLVRRDFAMLFDEGVSYRAISEVLHKQKSAIAAEIELFDFYRGTRIEEGKKSLAFRVLLQDTQKTLTDAEVDSAVSQLIQLLEKQFNAKRR